MSLAENAMSYTSTPVRPSKKKDLMIISEMHSTKIVGYLMYRHRVGLLLLSNFLLVSYFAWDKIVRVLF